jgi:hypothetical protein
MRAGLLLTGVLCLLWQPGCADMNEKAYQVRQEYSKNVELFGAVSGTYASAADNMADKKHELQKTLIDRTSDQWIEAHTDKDTGMLVASAADTVVFFKQRDVAVEQLVASKQSWQAVSDQYRQTIADLVALTKSVAAKDADVQATNEQLNKSFKSILGLAGAAGAGVAAGLGL